MTNSSILQSISLVLTLAISILPKAYTQNTNSGSPSSDSAPAQVPPTWLSDVVPLAGNVQSYPKDNSSIPTGSLPVIDFNAAGYPSSWKMPPTTSAEVQAVIRAIDWSKVPNSPVRKAKSNGDLDMSGYDSSDPDCWWSATGCVQSKNPLIPPDVSACPQVGDWGLTYDDGPLTESDGGIWAEPHLYDFLASQNQKAGLFYIGSNVIAAPAAAQRALASGHTLCVHTWSHPAMTSLSNGSVVAELYWTMKAIKEITGVTTKCWRPPYGDVDDRVRAIAWQMGLQTILWDEDTDDWNMPGEGGGKLPPSTVDGYFENWITDRKNGKDNKTGHIVLQHELNNSTVLMAEKWLPRIKQVFNVVPWNQCFNISHPYWETNFVYPINEQNSYNSTAETTRSLVNSHSTVTTDNALVSASSSSIIPSANTVSASSTISTSKSIFYTYIFFIHFLLFPF
ncbi:uncharacterized protein BX663DRAFT_445982 [Cokeromyces recurvatus]|uniref:uncharacterized protein n=1 Tax=Cokeromyces recurvatus TaxID=90255 RepID=UPI00222104C0|nr:uncharacterized protein BX663DRAFT_445982 [Cokeromyces recurvatus]KAI7907944.1 hypothetical protein BX663DRAFT_445982 [Cokeromyces recurvatus]